MTTDYPLSAGWRDFPRYPDPAIEILDDRFRQYAIFSAPVERLYTGCRWSEGPVWFGDGRYLLWSDIPQQPHPEMGGGNRRRQRIPAAPVIFQTATRATGRAGWSPASMAAAAWSVPSMTARSRC